MTPRGPSLYLVFLAVLAAGSCTVPPALDHCESGRFAFVDAADIDAVDDGNGVLSWDECWALCPFDPANPADPEGGGTGDTPLYRDSCVVDPKPAGRYRVECVTTRRCAPLVPGCYGAPGHGGGGR